MNVKAWIFIVVIAGVSCKELVGNTTAVGRTGICPSPQCEMNVNCAFSNDCCRIGDGKFCVPRPCPETIKCKIDSDCPARRDRCCPTGAGGKVCARGVLVV